MKNLRSVWLVRRSIRLKNFDYSKDGLFFITICTNRKRCIFGSIRQKQLKLSYWGEIAYACWNSIPQHFPQVILHEFVIMPNHVHGIIQICNAEALASADGWVDDTQPGRARGTSRTVGSIVRGFKIGVTKEIHRYYPKMQVWHRNYYEHYIQTQRRYDIITDYIRTNPERWNDDCFRGVE